MNLYGYEFQRESDLMHYGVLGMKWGIRRYQNKDGTLTAEGRKHYGNSGLTDKDARRLEKNISDLSKRKGYFEVKGSSKKRKDYLKKTAELKRDVSKSAFDIVKKSEDLSGIIDEARKCENIEEAAWEKWVSNEDAIRKTAEEYLKAKNNSEIANLRKYITGEWKASDEESLELAKMEIKERSSPSYINDSKVNEYLKDAGIDAYSHMWEFYTANSPELTRNSDRRYELTQQFMNTSKDVFNSLLGEYGQIKLSSVKWHNGSPTLSEYLSNQVNNDLYDYIWLGESMFSKDKR